MRAIITIITLLFFIPLISILNANKPPVANISGTIMTKGEPVPYASVQIKSTTIGTATDINGAFRLELPEGTHQLRVQAMGYKPTEISIDASEAVTGNFNIEMEEDALRLEQVVVTADRDERSRKESTSIVNALSSDMLSNLQITSLSEGLAFSPGLRVENNCGNCGSYQLRMNGLDGPYSQVLINGRPIFSGLASVYGLELLPANMIDRVEIIRGGGSALYGSNAIGGTVNVITREPISNRYEVQLQTSMVGVGSSAQPDNTIQFNTTLASENSKQGLAIYGFHRNRSPYDANGDGFSELSKIKNSTMGLHYTVKPGYKSKITADYFHIGETRRGGDAFDKPLHESNIAEAAEHQINSGNVAWHLFTAPDQELSFFAAGQSVHRDSYYGASQALDAYGTTKDFSYSAGSQYKINSGANNVIMGIEVNGGQLEDEKLGRSDEANTLVSDQRSTVGGVFSQWERKMGNFSVSAGLRADHYSIEDHISHSDISNTVLSPRLNILYGLNNHVQTRVSYAKGYRAPQVFDEDLHIETSEARQVTHVNANDLEQETSHSYMGSVSYQMQSDKQNLELLAEFFYTDLQNPFDNEFGEPNEEGVVVYTRVNEAAGAVVKGVNMEATWIPSDKWRINGSYTVQSSEFGAAREFGEKRFLRTPNHYGYLSTEWNPSEKITFNTNATYTGEMLVPYFGPLAGEDGELRTSDSFFDWSVNLKYHIRTNVGSFQIFAGLKNILNSYQSDFDRGGERDPGYIYGPTAPRTLQFGVKINNFL
ncbi:TonB-dependent receptor [Geofilum rubicundum]|uniref:TonB-dependent receptor n=1 Tax=Geofilum rubicundum JCM 15548 TaxID=1236989 RepID=A0A0E9M0I9_9BACT|nr:TonB-dependent receptor [Geofilum rubicundum]GAO30876.1 TonB-dependent receptor [Geofilum rubicundum JCM 15548]